MKIDTNLSAILLIGAVIALIALSGIAEGQVGANAIYDSQTHKAYAVATTSIKHIGDQGKFSLDFEGFAGTSTGPNASLVGGTTLCVSYLFTAFQLPLRFSVGPSFEVIGDRKPGWGLFFGVGARF